MYSMIILITALLFDSHDWIAKNHWHVCRPQAMAIEVCSDFFLDHRMGLFFCWRDGISNYAVLFHFQDIPSAAKSLSPWILEELWDVEDMVTSSWCITSGHGKTWQAGKSALPEDLRLSIRRAAVNSWGRFEDGGRWFWPSTVIFCMVC